MRTIKTQNIWQFIRKRIDVKNNGGSLTARYYDTAPDSYRLPEDYVEQYLDECKHGAYIVRSYGTPIAWTNDNGQTWTMPAVRYSVTTSRHQSQIHRATYV